jgi:flagellar biosynthetic protein FliR
VDEPSADDVRHGHVHEFTAALENFKIGRRRMPLDELLKFVPVFVLVLFRIAGLMLFAPLLGSAKIPKQVKALFAIILALGLTASVPPPAHLPDTTWGVAVGIGGEIMFGLAMGMILSFVFIAAQWAGQMVGQQMGLNLAEVIDPQFGGASSVISDFYYMLTQVVFLFVGGHRDMIRGIRDSFQSLPLLSVGIDASVLNLVVQMFSTATTLAMRLAAPVLVTMLVVDLTLGFLGKTMPQLNVMSAGMTVKSMIGLIVMIAGISLFSTPNVIQQAITDSMKTVNLVWHTPVITQN